jgi:hypothetical protein
MPKKPVPPQKGGKAGKGGKGTVPPKKKGK